MTRLASHYNHVRNKFKPFIQDIVSQSNVISGIAAINRFNETQVLIQLYLIRCRKKRLQQLL